MVVDESVLKKLRSVFNLNLYEVRIWIALLARGTSTAGELSDVANVPRSRTYDILESLEKRGFVVMKAGKPIKYVAIPPEEVVEKVKESEKKSLKERKMLLEKLQKSDTLEGLVKLYKRGVQLVNPAELSAAVKGEVNVRNHLDLMFKNARKSIGIYTSSDDIKKLAKNHFSLLKDAANRGVEIKIITSVVPENKKDVKMLLDIAKIRHVDEVDFRFYIADKEEIFFMILPEGEVHPAYDTGIWVQTTHFPAAIESLLEHAWEKFEHAEKLVR